MSGMHSYNYELARSLDPQSIKDYSAFTDKQWNSKADRPFWWCLSSSEFIN